MSFNFNVKYYIELKNKILTLGFPSPQGAVFVHFRSDEEIIEVSCLWYQS